jgi:hypothetical protein
VAVVMQKAGKENDNVTKSNVDIKRASAIHMMQAVVWLMTLKLPAGKYARSWRLEQTIISMALTNNMTTTIPVILC